MPTLVNTKLGEARGVSRVWLEGEKLAEAGYEPGMKLDLEPKGGSVLLTPSESGRFTVSKRTKNGRVKPLLEIRESLLAEIFDGVEMLRVSIQRGKIIITAHHQQGLINERVDRLIKKVALGEPLKVFSVFHGGGVLDKAIHAGMERAGIKSKLAAAVELESKYLDSSRRNNPELWDKDSIAIESPVQHVPLNRNPDPVDIVIGGIPCTGASKSGRSKNKLQFAESHEAAGAMFFSFLQIVQTLNPSVVIGENVPEYANTASMEVIRSVLGSLGYDVHEEVFDGPSYGALENRKRLCFVGISKGLGGFDLSNVKTLHNKPATIADILEDVPLDSDRWKDFSYLADKEKRDKAAGKGFARQLLTGEEETCGTIGKGYAKCRSTEPFIVHPLDPSLSRLFTPVEHCRVKNIPESVIDGLSDSVAHEVLGQSVIYSVFDAVGCGIGGHLKFCEELHHHMMDEAA
jgi:DNA (cytosine-5)-methyltransferase 1